MAETVIQHDDHPGRPKTLVDITLIERGVLDANTHPGPGHAMNAVP